MSEHTTEPIRHALGEASGQLSLYGIEQNREAVAAMVAGARHSVVIFTWDLDRLLYDQQPFLDSLKDLATKRRRSNIRVLLQNNERAIKHGHRLIHLARRLTSKFEIRRPHRDYIDHSENFIVVDGVGYVHRERYTQYESTADFKDLLGARKLTEFFDEVWERSEVDPELRSLYV